MTNATAVDTASIAALLETTPLSAVLRQSTWGAHSQAEFSDFEQALVKGTLTRNAYGHQLAQLVPAYTELAEASERLASDPFVAAVHHQGLDRRVAIERDVEYFLGSDWRDTYDFYPVSQEYSDRIREMAEVSPAGFVAHHYTRYLADLSGGVHIDRAITKAYGLETAGREFYVWDIENGNEFKKRYRSAIDDLPLDIDGKLAFIEEASLAYRINIDIIAELTRQIPDFASGT